MPKRTMEPDSPTTSPIKSSCPSSPLVSIASSPLQSSAPSSPIIEIPSSPATRDESFPPSSPEPSPFKVPGLTEVIKRRRMHTWSESGEQDAESLPPPSLTERGEHCCEFFSESEGEEEIHNEDLVVDRDRAATNYVSCDSLEEMDSESVTFENTYREELPFSMSENVDYAGCEENAASDDRIVFVVDSSVQTSGSHCIDLIPNESLTDSSSDDLCTSSSRSDEGSSESSGDGDASESSGSESEREDEEENDSDSDSEVNNYLSPKVYDGCALTEDEGVCILMDLFRKYKMSKKETGAILKGILKFLPNYCNMPKTEYGLFQYVEKLSPICKEIVHFYCKDCLYYLGLVEKMCHLCNGDSDKFFQLPLADQIRNLFENHGLADAIDQYLETRSNSNLNGYTDLLDGSEFQRARVDGGQYNLTFMGHTDGISVSESSFVSLWPLEYVLAELPPHLRFKYVLISGIWLGSKPYMNTYLKPFSEELQVLQEHGVQWIHPRTKQRYTSYISVPSFNVDAPVRAQLQNILSHGGKHCCNICEQKMKKLPDQPVLPGQKKKARRRVFTFEEATATLRSAERMEEQGRTAIETAQQENRKLKPKIGVKGPSINSSFPGCDRSTVVFPEYMHLILNLIKEFMTLWFSKNGPWSLKDHRETVNTFLLSIRVPDFITRIPRSTEHFSKWKANELRAFLLFYSVIILSKCLKPEYFQHWLLLVTAFYLLLQDCVSESDVSRANLLLRLFCRDFASLYKSEYYTYYVHNLSHLALVVQRHGPLQCNSTFMMEDFNGTLAKYIHGTKNQGKELVKNVRTAVGVEVLRARIESKFVQENQRLNNHIEFRNQIKDFDYSEAEVKQLLTLNNCKEPFKLYYRAVIKRSTFTCSLYTRQKRRNNYTICFSDSSENKVFGEIKYFCATFDNQKVAVVESFHVDHLNTFRHVATGVLVKHIVPIVPSGVLQVINLDAILFKVMRIGNFVCQRPNKLEYNL